MVSEPFQSAIPEGNWMYPAKLPAGGLPASFQALGKPEKSLYARAGGGGEEPPRLGRRMARGDEPVRAARIPLPLVGRG